MNKRHHIEIEILSITPKTITFAIKSQSHKEYNFNDGNQSFKCKNGITLYSFDCPEWREREQALYLRGSNPYRDTRPLVASSKMFEKISEAIREYNNHWNFIDNSFLDDLFKMDF